MDAKRAAVQLRTALGYSGLTLWEVARRSELNLATVASVLGGFQRVPLETIEAVGWALDLELGFVPTMREARPAGPVKSVVDAALEQLEPARAVAPSSGDAVVVLGAAGLLATEAGAIHARPGLKEFLDCCRGLFARIIVIADNKGKFRQQARTLMEEGAAPGWFADAEVLEDAAELKGAAWADEDVLLEVGEGGAAHPGQVHIGHYDLPYDQRDRELMRVLEELVRRRVAYEAEGEQAALMLAHAALQGLEDLAAGRIVDDPMAG